MHSNSRILEKINLKINIANEKFFREYFFKYFFSCRISLQSFLNKKYMKILYNLFYKSNSYKIMYILVIKFYLGKK